MANVSVDLEKIKLRDIMTTEVISVQTNSSAGEAAKLMLKNQIHGLCVTDPIHTNKVKYVVTSFDILGLTYFGRFSEDTDYINITKIEKIVDEQKVITFSPDDTLKNALEVVAEKNIRTLPIVENDLLVGVVSIIDLIRAITAG